MSEWWTYTLSDFLMFSPRTYYRLVELYNRGIWPLQVVALACGTALVALAARNQAWSDRLAACMLALAWLWVAWAFHVERYATINWAATYFAAAFVLQALLMITCGLRAPTARHDTRASTPTARRCGLSLMAAGVVVVPLIGLMSGRPAPAVEVFGVMPDPTIVTTLGALLCIKRLGSLLLWPIPLGWCAISASTSWTMHALDAWMLPVAAVVAVSCLLMTLRRRD